MKNIVVLVSGGGTNLQALIDAQNRGEIPNGKITCVISSNPNAYALERAKNNSIETAVIRRKDYEEFSDGSKGFAEFTEDGKKLLHSVERNGHEQINTLDSNGNVKSMKHKNWIGYDSYDEYIINDSITYKVS